MTTISDRELRDNPAEILRRVVAGESFDITDGGVVVAELGPPKAMNELDRLRSLGQVREAIGARTDLQTIRRVNSPWTTQEMIDDLRGS